MSVIWRGLEEAALRGCRMQFGGLDKVSRVAQICHYRFHGSSSSGNAEKSEAEEKAATGTTNPRRKTPIGKLDELEEGKHPYQEKITLAPFPDNTNPVTGEIGGPRGPEPTRYGDWERKGRVSDF